MSLGHLLYISDAIQPCTHEDLNAIRRVSMQNNAAHNITGVLFYSAGHYVQLLEGDTAIIHSLFEKIANDPRHTNIRLLVLRPAEKRVFADWSMGLLDLDDYTDSERQDLDELVRLASAGDSACAGTPVELEILSRFCMMLPSA